MVGEIPARAERSTAERHVALVVSILRSETSLAEAARKDGLTVAEPEGWRDRLLLGAQNALRSRPKDRKRYAPRPSRS